MNNNDEPGSKSPNPGQDPALRLAVAAAALGMTMGISPAAVLAVPAVAVGGDSATATEPLRLAAGYMKFDDIKGESQAGAMPPNRPPAVFPKLERPATAFPKVEMPSRPPHPGARPPAAFPKVEMRHQPPPPAHRPPAAFGKIEPPAMGPGPARPPAAYYKITRPAPMPGEGGPYPGSRKP